MYFSQFPKIFYDFPQDLSSTNLQILTDITTNVRVRKEVLENITIYDEYDIQEGETPEIIAERVYGDPELHWVIMLANQRYDYLEDFPMTSLELENMCIAKYGADHLDDIHHYERDDVITEGRASLKLPSTPSTLVTGDIKVNDFIIGSNAKGRVESIDVNLKVVTLLMDFGLFKPNEACTVWGVRYDDTLPGNVYTSIRNFTVPTNGFEVNENYSAITNYIYEIRANEKKRRIKLISKELISQVIREFKSLVKPS